MIKTLQCLLACLLLFTTHSLTAEETTLVAVASSFAPVAEELSQQFLKDTGKPIRLSAGATGTLTRQIQRGAPFELFLSADEDHVYLLEREGFTLDTGKIYAVGVLVLFIPYTTRLDRMQNISDMILELVSGESLRLALANPDTAPYGRAAREVLHRFHPGVTGTHEIIGENAGQVARFALTGNVDAAMIPLSLALDKDMQSAGHFEFIPAEWYSPVRQRMVLIQNAGTTARAFFNFIGSKTAQQVMQKYGYTLPEGE